jgi:TM2 domain-containing membrane protein YozV
MVKFCPECGKSILNDSTKFCENCGTSLMVSDTLIKKSPQEIVEEKSSFVAVLCSFFIPGLGQVYNGETEKGILIYLGTLIGIFIFFIPGLIIWISGLYDSYSTAKKMNNKEIAFKPTKTAHMILFFILAVIIAAIVIFFVVLYALSVVLAPLASGVHH